MVRGRDDPRPVVRSIAAQAWAEGGPLLSWCHGVMHTVGRRYAGDSGVRLATLMDALPKGNDPACTAGFAHGLVTAVAARRRPIGARPRPRERALTPRPATSATAASTASVTRSCAPAATWRRRSTCAGRSASRRRTAPRARTTTTGSPRSASTTRGSRASRSEPADPVRRAAGRVRAAVLVPGVRREPPRGVRGRDAGGPRRLVRRAARPAAVWRASPRRR